MNFETILYEKKDRIAVVTMNKPEIRNAQNARMIEEMDEAFIDADKDPDIHVVILRGAGPSFCSGHDMRLYPVEEGAIYRPDRLEEKWEWERDYFFDRALRTWTMKKPTIAEVQGHCVAAGLMIANLCDLIIAADDAVFIDPVPRMGVASAEVFSYPWVLPPRKAKELLFTGGRMTAEEAYQYGMVNRVVPRERLSEETWELARKIAEAPPFGVQMIKRSINRTLDIMGFTNALNAHFDTHVMSHWTHEAQETFERRRRESASIKEFVKKRDQG